MTWANSSKKARHQLQRLIDAGMATCHRCGQPVQSGQLWDVDHRIGQDIAPHLVHDPDNWAIAHRYCNRAAGARYGNRKRTNARGPLPDPSRPW